MKRTVPDIGSLTPELLARLRLDFQPRGSGPLGVMRKVVQLCEAIADEKGWNLDEVEFEEKSTRQTTIEVTTRYRGLKKLDEQKPYRAIQEAATIASQSIASGGKGKKS